MLRASEARLRSAAEAFVIPVAALAAAMVLFGVFMALIGQNPLEVYRLIWRGGFSSGFAWQNTLSRAAPLILTALCVALPAQAGLMVIAGEGALVLGGLASAMVGYAMAGDAPLLVKLAMAVCGMLAGGLWVAFVGMLRQYRGVNETISSLLFTYIAIALFNHMVEGPLRDPASLNKPSTHPIGDASMLGRIPGFDVHWGLAFGVLFCIAMYVLVRHTTWGFALRIVGGNPRAAQLAGLPHSRLVVVASPAWWRLRRCTALQTLHSSPATAIPASWSPSSRARTRSRSFRWRSCSAASPPPAACCSGASICPTPRCRCCKAWPFS
jgi:simple sugar transport system permease protein